MYLTDSKVMPSKTVNGVTTHREIISLAGLSTESKPVTTYKGVYIASGSTYFAMDTSTVYMYDEDNAQWHELG